MAVSTKAIRDLLMPGLLEVASEQERAKDMANLKWPPRDPKDEGHVTITWGDVLMWLFIVGVVYSASFLPDLLGYAE